MTPNQEKLLNLLLNPDFNFDQFKAFYDQYFVPKPNSMEPVEDINFYEDKGLLSLSFLGCVIKSKNLLVLEYVAKNPLLKLDEESLKFAFRFFSLDGLHILLKEMQKRSLLGAFMLTHPLNEYFHTTILIQEEYSFEYILMFLCYFPSLINRYDRDLKTSLDIAFNAYLKKRNFGGEENFRLRLVLTYLLIFGAAEHKFSLKRVLKKNEEKNYLAEIDLSNALFLSPAFKKIYGCNAVSMDTLDIYEDNLKDLLKSISTNSELIEEEYKLLRAKLAWELFFLTKKNPHDLKTKCLLQELIFIKENPLSTIHYKQVLHFIPLDRNKMIAMYPKQIQKNIHLKIAKEILINSSVTNLFLRATIQSYLKQIVKKQRNEKEKALYLAIKKLDYQLLPKEISKFLPSLEKNQKTPIKIFFNKMQTFKFYERKIDLLRRESRMLEKQVKQIKLNDRKNFIKNFEDKSLVVFTILMILSIIIMLGSSLLPSQSDDFSWLMVGGFSMAVFLALAVAPALFLFSYFLKNSDVNYSVDIITFTLKEVFIAYQFYRLLSKQLKEHSPEIAKKIDAFKNEILVFIQEQKSKNEDLSTHFKNASDFIFSDQCLYNKEIFSCIEWYEEFQWENLFVMPAEDQIFKEKLSPLKKIASSITWGFRGDGYQRVATQEKEDAQSMELKDLQFQV